MRVCVRWSVSECSRSAFNIYNHHHDPCQINRERLDGRQGAKHMMEKGSWEREVRAEGGVAELQTFTFAPDSYPEQRRINATVKYTVSTYYYKLPAKTCLNHHTNGLEQKLTDLVWEHETDYIPVAVACCSLCEVGTTAMCRWLGPRWQLCPGCWPAGLLLEGKENQSHEKWAVLTKKKTIRKEYCTYTVHLSCLKI